MALQLRRTASMRVRLVTTLIAAFAFIVQPYVGIIASQNVNALAVTDRVVINEISPSPSSGNNEWVELYNPTSAAIDISSWIIADADSHTQALAGVVGASGFLSINITTSGLLNNSGDTVKLSNGTTAIDTVIYPALTNDKSYARTYDANDVFEVRNAASVTKNMTNGSAPATPVVCTYDFTAQKMWEVTWGYGFEDRNGGAPVFTPSSNGGLVTINGMPTTWNDYHLYVTEGNNRHYDYGFADGTVRTVDVTFSEVNGCQIPEIVWGQSWRGLDAFPSTNANNKANGRHYVEQTTTASNKVALKFTNPTNFTQYFEIRKDNAASTLTAKYNPCRMGVMPLDGSCNGKRYLAAGDLSYSAQSVLPHETKTVTYANNNVDVRVTYGPERNWDFNWTPFVSHTQPKQVTLVAPTAPVKHNAPTALKWATTDTDIKEFIYQRFANSTCSGTAAHTKGGIIAKSYTDPAFTADDFSWHVKAISNDPMAAQGPWSECFKVSVDKVQPVQVQLTSPTNNAFVNSRNGVKHTWTTTDNDVQEFIYISTYDEAGTERRSSKGGLTSPTYTDTKSSQDGDVYYWQVKTTDQAGNQGPWSPRWKVTVDNTVPTLSVDTPTNLVTNKDVLKVTGSVSDSNLAEYKYQILDHNKQNTLGSTGWSRVGGTTNVSGTLFNADISGLNDGTYYVSVWASDKAGNATNVAGDRLSTPYIMKFTVDRTAPIGTATYVGGNNIGGTVYVKSINDLSFTETIDDSNGTVRATYLVQKLNPVTNVFEGFCGNWNAGGSGSHVLAGLTHEVYTETHIKNCASTATWADGTYKIFHAAYDAAGNEGKYNANRQIFVIDSTLPVFTLTDDGNPRTSITNGSTINPSQLGDVDHNGNSIRFTKQQPTDTLYVNGQPIFSHGYYNHGTSGQIGAAFTHDGAYTVYIKDLAGNQSTPINFTVDTTAPDNLAIQFNEKNSGDIVSNSGITNEEFFTFNLTANGNPDRWQLKYWNDIADASFNDKNHPWVQSNLNGYSSSLGVYNDRFSQGEGTHYFAFSACDIIGNCSDYSEFKVTYDKTPPSVAIDPLAALTNDNTPTVTGTIELGASLKLKENGIIVMPTITGTTWSYTPGAALADAEYEYIATATDTASNVSDPVTRKVTVDTLAPSFTVVDYGQAGNVIQPNVNYTPSAGDSYFWSAAPAGVTVSDATALRPTFTVTQDGNYSFDLTIRDAAGNEDTKTFNFTYKTPATPLVSDDTTTTADAFTGVTLANATAAPVTLAADGDGVQAVLGATDTNADATEEKLATVNTSDVKGAETTATQADNKAEAGCGTFLGICWYWWIPIVLAAILAAYYLFRPRREEV